LLSIASRDPVPAPPSARHLAFAELDGPEGDHGDEDQADDDVLHERFLADISLKPPELAPTAVAPVICLIFSSELAGRPPLPRQLLGEADAAHPGARTRRSDRAERRSSSDDPLAGAGIAVNDDAVPAAGGRLANSTMARGRCSISHGRLNGWTAGAGEA
jgi:hypothetical protein